MNTVDMISQKPSQVTQARQGPEDAGDTIDLSSLLGALWRGKFIIAAFMIATTLLAGFYAYAVAVPKFTSTAVVVLNSREEQVVDIESVVGGLGGGSEIIATEVEVLRSRSLLGKVVDRLDLMSDPEFNRSLVPPSTMDSLKQLIRSFFGASGGSGASSTPELQARRQREGTISQLLGSLNIRVVPQSLVFQIIVETTDPRKSALIADTIAELYIRDQLDAKFSATEQATSWLSSRVADLQIQLEEAEEKVKLFRANTDLVSTEALQGLEVQLKEIRDRIANVVAARDTAETRLAEMQAAADDGTESPDAEQARLRLQLDVTRMNDQVASLESLRTQLENQIDQQSSDLIELQQLTRESEANRLLYEYFLSRLKETSVQQGIQQADSRVLSEAVIPGGPSAPNKPLIMAAGMFVGLLLGMGLVLWREAARDTFRSAGDLERISGRPAMGQIPLIPTRKRKDAITYLRQKPTSAVAEAIRNLRTSVLLSNIDNPPKLIMVTSSLPGEGKTTVSIALAQNTASMGRKTLLIEGDVRRRIFGEYFDVPEKKGLGSVLFESRSLAESVVQVPDHDFDVLLGDKGQANPADLLSSNKFAALLQEARETYDQIVIDTPPVLVVPDARIVAQLADVVLFVVRWDKTLKAQVMAGLHEFDGVNRGVDGLVLNQINQRKMRSYGRTYGSYGAYGGYGAYGSKYYNN
ncbi:GumC family protein [Chachezhania antarctica]|uniref:GumC family protein n=1 Tax=Chachezhania antarctica TaxID=2340860 RepID=UPI0030845615